MSAQEFKVGQRIIGPDYTRLPVGAKVNNVWEKVAPNDWRNTNFPDQPHTDDDLHNPRPLTHLPDATEPEDKDDAYVEPEPLKNDDPVLVWAKYRRTNHDGIAVVAMPQSADAVSLFNSPVHPDAIVRPSVGLVPPWVTVEAAEAKAISAIRTALVVDGGMHDDRYTQQTAESLYRAGIRATKDGAS